MERLREQQETLDECARLLRTHRNQSSIEDMVLLHGDVTPMQILEHVRSDILSPQSFGRLVMAIGLCQAEIAKILITLLTDLDTRKAE